MNLASIFDQSNFISPFPQPPLIAPLRWTIHSFLYSWRIDRYTHYPEIARARASRACLDENQFPFAGKHTRRSVTISSLISNQCSYQYWRETLNDNGPRDTIDVMIGGCTRYRDWSRCLFGLVSKFATRSR